MTRKLSRPSPLQLTHCYSDTTASTLTSIFYELARFPETVSRLRNELKSLLDVGEDISNSNLQYLSLLNGVINEALRLYPPAGLLQRNTPAEGITIGQTFVPGNTTVFCPFFVTGRSEFPRIKSFLRLRLTT